MDLNGIITFVFFYAFATGCTYGMMSTSGMNAEGMTIRARLSFAWPLLFIWEIPLIMGTVLLFIVFMIAWYGAILFGVDITKTKHDKTFSNAVDKIASLMNVIDLLTNKAN